jgi:plastocyanin
MRRLAILCAAALLAACAAPAAAQDMGHGEHGGAPAGTNLSILFGAFDPTQRDVLVGDTVTWTNDSVRAHTVNATDGSWASLALAAGRRFSRQFTQEGPAAYYCAIHPFMRGEIDVYSLLLDAPPAAAQPGRDFPVSGRSSLTPGTDVTIEADDGSGFAPVGHAAVGADGAFRTTIRPRAPAQLRATAGDEASPAVQMLVLDRKVLVTRRAGRGGRVTLDVHVTPPSPHDHVVVQLKLPERFGWWPVRFGMLGDDSSARFRLRPGRRVPARVVLTLADDATPLAISRRLRVGRRSARP